MALVAVTRSSSPRRWSRSRRSLHLEHPGVIAPTTFDFQLARGVGSTITSIARSALNALTFEKSTRSSPRPSSGSIRIAEVRAVVITGRGRGFCSGGDQDDIIKELLGRDTPALVAFTRATAPVDRSDPRVQAPGDRRDQRHRRRRGRGDRGRVRSAGRRGDGAVRLHLPEGRVVRRRHGRDVSVAAHRRPRSRERAAVPRRRDRLRSTRIGSASSIASCPMATRP